MEKKTYITPQIEFIILDNKISLQLESNPPAGPDELGQRQQINHSKLNDIFNA